jgi:hypothetical protein
MACDLCCVVPCICPVCPVCGERGSILCYVLHGQSLTPEQGRLMAEQYEAEENAKPPEAEEAAAAERQMLLADKMMAEISQILADHPPDLQGMVIADLTAVWLHGHRVEGNAQMTDAMRRQLLDAHVNGVMRLVEYYNSAEEDDD